MKPLFLVVALALTIVGSAAIGAQTTDSLDVCHAGSVSAAFTVVEQAFSAQHPSVKVNDVSGGSVALAARMASGAQPCDVYAAADYLDVDLLLKPASVADFTIVFARGRMVLAYLATDPLTKGIAAPGEFRPPSSIPNAAADWYRVLLVAGVRVSTSHPFLDPSGYRAHMMAQLAQTEYRVPNLANLLVEHFSIVPAAPPGVAAPAMGKDFDFQFIYEHSAAAAAKTNPSYRYVALPDSIGLSTSTRREAYAKASVTMPGLGLVGARSPVTIPAARVAWGLTIPLKSAHKDNAAAFLGLLLGPTGKAAFDANGPEPITPALVSASDSARLPKSVRTLVTSGPALP